MAAINTRLASTCGTPEDELIKAAKRLYKRDYYQRTKERVKAQQNAYWLRKAKEYGLTGDVQQ